MKKSIVYLGVALVLSTNVALASNQLSQFHEKTIISISSTATPLGTAICKGDVEAVKKFIEYGADVNEKSNDLTPLMLAARYNKIEILKLLVSKGARIYEKDLNGFTALKYAELSNAKEAVAILKQS